MDTHQAGSPANIRLGIRVDCVVRRDHPSAHHRVQAIGGTSRDGESWRLSEEAAIAAIENERATFYVEWPKGHRLDVVVAQGLGKRYLKTEVDGELPDRLLALPDCG
jgi:Protein of unknown function (DUF3892)